MTNKRTNDSCPWRVARCWRTELFDQTSSISEISTRLYHPDESSIFQTSVIQQMVYLSMCNLFYHKVLKIPIASAQIN